MNFRLIPQPDPDARFKSLRCVQSMRSRSTNEEVRLGERYQLDDMGSHEFTTGGFARQLRRLNEVGRVGQIVVDRELMQVIYDPTNFNLEGAQYAVEMLYLGHFHPQDYIAFTKRYREEYKHSLTRHWRKQYTKLNPPPLVRDAWLDIDVGLFWTWAKINIRGVQRNIRKSVEWMDEQKKAQDQPS